MPGPDASSPITASAYTGNALVDALLYSIHWAPPALTFSFAGTASPWSADYPESLHAYGVLGPQQQAIVRSALQAWDVVAGLDLVEVAETATDVGDLRFAFSHPDPSPWGDEPMPYAWAHYPDSHPSGGDIWFNADFNRPDGPDWTPDTFYGYYYMAILHEIGHALGLKHPFDPGVNLPAQYDNRGYTIMSYNRVYSWEPTTPMLLDILAIQSLYGADTKSRDGDDVYRYDAAGTYFETIWDSGGTDTIVATGGRGAHIDLRAGEASQIGQDVIDLRTHQPAETLWIAYGCTIENAIGGSGSDELIGNDAANRLDGGAGADRMAGGAGNDRYTVDHRGDVVIERGGGGEDTVLSSVSYTLPSHVEHASLTGKAVNLTGNALGNTLTGSKGANRLDGGAGKDTLAGGKGADSFMFSTGLDARRNVDAIVDFSSTDDRLLLDRDVFDALGRKVTGGEFRLGRSARDASDNLIYDAAAGKLYYDADGKGGHAAVLFATLEPGTPVALDDFWMV